MLLFLNDRFGSRCKWNTKLLTQAWNRWYRAKVHITKDKVLRLFVRYMRELTVEEISLAFVEASEMWLDCEQFVVTHKVALELLLQSKGEIIIQRRIRN